ncbi:HNH endonuclease [Acidovorax sp. Leaf73]|uniref:HNH endonuclease n=1 Tax=Acidovorax sp. Leaf73 TaxID=2876566 RepID=UPI001E4CCF5E|nr:HNH endonuclease signature motif containing protein [Acidovorax sp. Leaf73]
MREGLDRVIDALRLAADGLDQLFERKGTKSHMMPNPDGHPWIRVIHPMEKVRFIGITPNRGDGPIYLKLRIFLYEQYQEEFDRLLLGKFFSFEGEALPRNPAYPGASWSRYLEDEDTSVVGYEATINVSAWPDETFDARIRSLCEEFCLFAKAVVTGGAEYDALPDTRTSEPAPAWLRDEAALEELLGRHDLRESEILALVKVRIGQSDYRQQLIQRWGGCSVTGCKLTEFLIASHIHAWGKCESADERWDPDNGLLLTPSLDKLFDLGLISFVDNGKVVIHPRLERGQMHHFGVDQNIRLRRDVLTKHPGIMKYLKLHREINGLEPAPAA